MPYPTGGGGVSKADVTDACGSALTLKGYVTAVSARIDTAISSISGAATVSLNASGVTNVQNAMTNQGYTAARAAFLNTAIGSRAVTGAPMSLNASGITHIQTALTNQGLTTSRAGYLDGILTFAEDDGGTATMDGTEQTLKEWSAVTGQYDMYVDLTNLAGGDTARLRQYMKIKNGGSYVLFGSEQYSGAQSIPLVYIQVKPNRRGMKVTLCQSAGTNRNVDWETTRIKGSV